MADKNAEIQALQAIVMGLSSQSFSHRIQGLVFGSKGLTALADKYAEHADLQETNQDLELIELIGVQNWLVQKLTGTAASTAE